MAALAELRKASVPDSLSTTRAPDPFDTIVTKPRSPTPDTDLLTAPEFQRPPTPTPDPPQQHRVRSRAQGAGDTHIDGAEHLTAANLIAEIRAGARFRIYSTCISVFVLTFQRPTNVKFIASHRNATQAGLPYVLITLVFGWWGFPWGPILTIGSLVRCLRGGTDVTASILENIESHFWEGFANEAELRQIQELWFELS